MRGACDRRQAVTAARLPGRWRFDIHTEGTTHESAGGKQRVGNSEAGAHVVNRDGTVLEEADEVAEPVIENGIVGGQAGARAGGAGLARALQLARQCSEENAMEGIERPGRVLRRDRARAERPEPRRRRERQRSRCGIDHGVPDALQLHGAYGDGRPEQIDAGLVRRAVSGVGWPVGRNVHDVPRCRLPDGRRQRLDPACDEALVIVVQALEQRAGSADGEEGDASVPDRHAEQCAPRIDLAHVLAATDRDPALDGDGEHVGGTRGDRPSGGRIVEHQCPIAGQFEAVLSLGRGHP